MIGSIKLQSGLQSISGALFHAVRSQAADDRKRRSPLWNSILCASLMSATCSPELASATDAATTAAASAAATTDEAGLAEITVTAEKYS
jgi:hypothetical protein